jgi:hypothetical protein
VPYTPQTWANEQAGGTPISAARLQYIETGIQTAQATGEAAGGGAVQFGKELSTFSGATDDAKLTTALAYVQAQQTAVGRTPAILFTENRQYGPFTTTRTLFNGLRMVGYPGGPKNFEISSGQPVQNNLQVNCGTGTSSWWVGNGASRYDVYFSGLTLTSTNANTQFLAQEDNTLYACEFNNLTFYGFKHVLGRPAAKCLMTQVVLTGHWTTIAIQDTQYTMGGSDCELWNGGYNNMQASTTVAGADRYQIELSAMSKTNVGKIYCTSENNWRGVKVTGSSQKLTFFGTVFEGRNAATPCVGTVLRIEGGNVSVRDPWLAYAMSAPDAGENGVIHVTGGDVIVDGPAYERATGVAETVPLLYQSGGRVHIYDVQKAGTWSGLPRVQTVGGTLVATDGTWTLV